MNIDEQRRIRQIIDDRKAGDNKSAEVEYARIVRQYSRYVFDFIGRMVSDVADTEELAQDTFVKAYRYLDSFVGKSSFKTWITRIAYHETLNYLKRKRIQWVNLDDVATNDDAPLDVELSTGNEAHILLLEEALEDLPPDERMLIHLFYYEDRPLQEIAYIMESVPNTLGVRLHRIRKKLLCMIKQKENGQNK